MAWMIRLLNLLLRGGLMLCTLLLVLLALYVSLGRALMPLIAEYRAEIQQRAESYLGMPLRIGRLEGSWRDFGPLLVAHDIELGEGDERIHLATLRIKPDLLVGLLERRLRAQRIELEGLRLTIRQAHDHGWSMVGVPAATGTDPVDPLQVLGAISGVAQLLLLDSQVTLQPLMQPPLSLGDIDIELRNGRKQRLDGRLTLPDGMPLSFSLRGKLGLPDWKSSAAKLYLSVPQGDWTNWLPAELLSGVTVAHLQAGGELWLAAEEGQLQRAVARIHAPQVDVSALGRSPQSLQDLTLTAYLDSHPHGYDLRLDSLALTVGETRIGPMQLAMQQRPEDATQAEQWRLQADRLDLGPLTGLALALAPLPTAVEQWLGGLKPHGQLNNLQLAFEPTNSTDQQLVFASNLSAVGISAYEGVPGLKNVTGSIGGNLGGGELRLQSEDFVLDLVEVFPQPWSYRRAMGGLRWTLDEQSFVLRSRYLRLDGEDCQIAGDLTLDIPFAPELFSSMDLRVGLREGNVATVHKYLPSPSADFTPELANWLKTAIAAAVIDEGLFQYRGTLSAAAPADTSTLSMYFKVHDLQLNYQPGWPALREAVGEVFVGDDGVRVDLSSAAILDSQLSAVQASVAPAAKGQAPKLQLSADLQSSLADALTFLQQAPLGVESIFAGWSGQGPLAAKLQLDIPLEGSAPPVVVVDFSTQNAQLKMPSPELQLTRIAGTFRYSSASGLSSPAFQARAFKQPVSGKIRTEGTGGTSRTQIEANGEIALTALTAWLGVDKQPLPLSGSMPYKLNLILADKIELQVNSNLKGLTIDLPAPFGKKTGEVRSTELRMPLATGEQSYQVQYGNLASLALAAPAGDWSRLRGELVLGGATARLPSEPGLWVRGRLTELDVAAWQDFAKSYVSTAAAGSSNPLRKASLKIDRFSGFGQKVENLAVELARQPAAWQIGLSSTLAEGKLGIPDQSGLPLVVDLQRLNLPEPPTSDAEAENKPDPLGNIDPASIPALDLTVAQVFLGKQLLGPASFKLRPTGRGLRITELNLNLKGLLIGGEAGWEGPVAASRSWYKGRLQGGNLADVLRAWNFAPSVISKSFRVDADVSWPGSPLWLKLSHLSGTLDASLRNGSFVELEGGSGALRVFGLLNLNGIGRRLRLDFSDVFSKGLPYDRITALLAGSSGVFTTKKPLLIKGPAALIELNGRLNLVANQINAQLDVTLPVSNTATLAALLAGAPIVAGTIFVVDKVADKLFGRGVTSMAKVKYKVQGSLNDPQMTLNNF